MQRIEIRQRGLLLGVAIAALAGAAHAAASSAPAQVGEVVVTAQKRSERLMSVAAPVTALTASDLKRDVAIKLEDFVAKTPGLNLISDRDGETQIVLRGITTGSPVSSTVATYVDDTPYGSSTGDALGGWFSPDLDPSDLQRVEILRGPQGTLYGASSLGGLVKYVTTPPNSTAMAGRVEFDGSSTAHGGDGWGVRGMLNIPLVTDQLAIRVSAYDRHDAGYIDNPQLGLKHVNGADVEGGRFSMLWTPNTRLSVRLTAVAQNMRSDGSSDEDVNIDGSTITPVVGPLQQIRYADEPLHVRYRVYSGTVNYDLGFASLTSITSFSTLRETAIVDETQTFGPIVTEITGIPNFGTSTGSDLRLDKLTEELRLASPTGQRLEWQAGFFYTHEFSTRAEPTFNFDTVTGAELLPQNALFFANLRSTYTEYAFFGDLTYRFTPKFDLQAGLRYSHNDQNFALYQSGLFVGGVSNQAGTSADHSVTFLVTPRYRFDDNNMLYARVASGYRPGGPNAPTPQDIAAGVPLAYQPDTLTDYDVGYKATLFDHRLTLDLSAFYIDWQNIQIVTDFNGITSNGNGGSARSDGFEGAITLIPVKGLSLVANLAYTNAELTEDAPGVNGRNGDALPNVPKWAAGFNADYDFTFANGIDGFVGGTVRFLGARPSGFVTGSPADFVRPSLPAYTTVDLRAGVSHGGLSFELYVKNLGDVRGLNNITSLNLSGYTNPWTASVIRPRTVGMSVSAAF